MAQLVFTLKNNVSSENIFFYKITGMIMWLSLIHDCDVIIFCVVTEKVFICLSGNYSQKYWLLL